MSSPAEIDGKDVVQEQLEGPSRYAAYLMRLRTLITASSRYIAYSSDIGEAFRPLTSPGFVRGAYAVSWLYLLGDVSYAGYKAHLAHHEAISPLQPISAALSQSTTSSSNAAALAQLSPAQKVELKKREFDLAHDPTLSARHSEVVNVGLVVARRAVFQTLASMALPAFTIHSIVRYSAPLFARSASARVRNAGPTVAGLAFVPALPYVFDEPVEHVVDAAFDLIEGTVFGDDAAKKEAQAKEELKAAASSLKETGQAIEQKLEKAKETLTGSSAASKALILGVGIDVLYLPRLRTLLHRHAQRMAAAAARRPKVMGAPDSIRRFALPATVGAGVKLADRIGSERERAQFRELFASRKGQGSDTLLSSSALRWLALRA